MDEPTPSVLFVCLFILERIAHLHMLPAAFGCNRQGRKWMKIVIELQWNLLYSHTRTSEARLFCFHFVFNWTFILFLLFFFSILILVIFISFFLCFFSFSFFYWGFFFLLLLSSSFIIFSEVQEKERKRERKLECRAISEQEGAGSRGSR